MQAIELETDIDENREIHLKLPPDVRARQTWVVVLDEQPAAGAPSRTRSGPDAAVPALCRLIRRVSPS
jgi:hypothetical protein